MMSMEVTVEIHERGVLGRRCSIDWIVQDEWTWLLMYYETNV